MTMPRDPTADAKDSITLWDLPVIDTPFTRMAEHWCTQQGAPCADFEMDYTRCAARVGLKNVHKYCSEYLADWKECQFKLKSAGRYIAMQKERKKQGVGFKEPPPPDSVHTLY